MAVQEGPTGIQVSWISPTPLGDTTGYRIYYSGGSSGSVDVSGGSTDNRLLTDLQNGASYTISIVGTSEHLFSVHVNDTESISLSKSVNISTKTSNINFMEHVGSDITFSIICTAQSQFQAFHWQW